MRKDKGLNGDLDRLPMLTCQREDEAAGAKFGASIRVQILNRLQLPISDKAFKVSLGIVLDKISLVDGEPTQIIEHRGES